VDLQCGRTQIGEVRVREVEDVSSYDSRSVVGETKEGDTTDRYVFIPDEGTFHTFLN
jgi:hypothetical protein